ncbi:MAG: hypothetical protein IKJ08_05095 [Alistipes sp.]|nr:hypothetical protein [Alistipes sp.]
MRSEQINIGSISNKAFLLLVIDTINTFEDDVKRANTDTRVIVDNIGIASETHVDASYTSIIANNSTSIKYKVSFAYKNNLIDIEVCLLSYEYKGKILPPDTFNNPKFASLIDKVLYREVQLSKTRLLSKAKNMNYYETLSGSLTDDSVWDGTIFDSLPSSDIDDISIYENLIQLPFHKVIRLKSAQYSDITYVYLSTKGVFDEIGGVLVGEISVDENALIYTKNIGYSSRYMRISNNGGKIVIVRGDGRIKHEDSYIVEAIVDVFNISTSKEILSSNSRRIIQNGIANLFGN